MSGSLYLPTVIHVLVQVQVAHRGRDVFQCSRGTESTWIYKVVQYLADQLFPASELNRRTDLHRWEREPQSHTPQIETTITMTSNLVRDMIAIVLTYGHWKLVPSFLFVDVHHSGRKASGSDALRIEDSSDQHQLRENCWLIWPPRTTK